MKRYKYPRTPHLPWSEGATDDDERLSNIDHFVGKHVVVTEKMDGENTTFYNDYYHARSLESKDHPSRHWIKGYWSGLAYTIPNGWRICGENMFAKHSIYYDALPSYFLMFSLWQDDHCASWDVTTNTAKGCNISLVPVLYYGIWDENKIKSLFTGVSKFDGEQEGYVVRLADEFLYQNFDKCVAKFVRKNHVTTDEHWKQQAIIQNRLRQ